MASEFFKPNTSRFVAAHEMPKLPIGASAPLFKLPDGSGSLFSLAEHLGKGAIVVFFYPRDFTPGCTMEVCAFRDRKEELLAAGATCVVGISSDTVKSHLDFGTKYKANYPLLSDEGGVVRSQFGVERGLLGFVDGRATYVLDSAGVIRHKYANVLTADAHVREALAGLALLATGAAKK